MDPHDAIAEGFPGPHTAKFAKSRNVFQSASRKIRRTLVVIRRKRCKEAFVHFYLLQIDTRPPSKNAAPAMCWLWPARQKSPPVQAGSARTAWQRGYRTGLAEDGPGPGEKAHLFYDWAVIDLAEAAPGHRRLLIRRERTTGELAYYG